MQSSIRRRGSYAVKKIVTGAVFFFLWRAFRALSHTDSRFRAELDSWPDGLTLHMQGSKTGPHLCLRKGEQGLERLKACEHPAVDIHFKSLDEAFKLATGRLGVARAYAEHRFTLSGDIGLTMSFVRCVNLAEAYLFPKFISRRILLAVPAKEFSSLGVYRRVIFGR